MAEQNTKLPKDWKWTKLGDIANYINGRGFKKSEWENNGLPIIRIQNLNKDVSSYNYTTKIFEDRYKVKNGDLLFAWAASLGTYLWKGNDAWLNQHIFKIEPKEFCDKIFLFYSLEKIIAELYSKTHGSGMVHVTKSRFEATLIPLPPIKTQLAIVSKIEELFSELDKGIEDLKTAQLQLKTYRESVLKWAFEGKKRILFENIIESSQNGLSKRSGLDGEELKVLRLADIKNNSIVVDNPRKIKMTSSEILKYKLNEEDLVCIRVNGSKDLVGKIVFVTKNDTKNKWAFCDHFIRFTIKKNFSSKFIYHYFQTMEVRKFIHDNMVTSAGQNTVSQVTIKNVLVPDCILEEQNLIVQEIESRLSVADKMEESITQSLLQAEALRQSILKKAFSGELI